jgi:hypothetical protein
VREREGKQETRRGYLGNEAKKWKQWCVFVINRFHFWTARYSAGLKKRCYKNLHGGDNNVIIYPLIGFV